MLRRTFAAVQAATILAGVAAGAHAQTPSAGTASSGRPRLKPTLVVFITVDQLRGDYFTRFGRQFTGGLHRFDVAGAHFTNAFQDHANTETAPGHASTMSGRFPVHTGIAANTAGVNDPGSPLIGSSDPGASPFRFRGTTLLDWMRQSNAATRFLSVSRKDRAAILPIGKSKGDVYWYASNGTFTQSQYYGTELPRWVTTFNAQQHPLDYAGWKWTPLRPDTAYAEPDSVPVEALGRDFLFPHTISDDPTEPWSPNYGSAPVRAQSPPPAPIEPTRKAERASEKAAPTSAAAARRIAGLDAEDIIRRAVAAHEMRRQD